jgi:hypothetical protein
MTFDLATDLLVVQHVLPFFIRSRLCNNFIDPATLHSYRYLPVGNAELATGSRSGTVQLYG